MKLHAKEPRINPLPNLQPKPVPLQRTIDFSLIRSLLSSPPAPKDSNFQSTTSCYNLQQLNLNIYTKACLHSSRVGWFHYPINPISENNYFWHKAKKTHNTKQLNMAQRDQISAWMPQSWLHNEPHKGPDPNTEQNPVESYTKTARTSIFRADWNYSIMNWSLFQTCIRTGVLNIDWNSFGCVSTNGNGELLNLVVVVVVVQLLVLYCCYYYCLVPLLSLLLYHFLSISLFPCFLSLLQSIKIQPPLFLAVFFIPGKKRRKDPLERERVSDFFL